MTDATYRRYTTTELRDMPDTARLVDEWGQEWRPHQIAGNKVRGYGCGQRYTFVYRCASELARRKLRRIDNE